MGQRCGLNVVLYIDNGSASWTRRCVCSVGPRLVRLDDSDMLALEMARKLSLTVASVLPLFSSSALGIELDTSSPESVSQAAKSIVSSLMDTYYNATSTSGRCSKRPYHPQIRMSMT